MTRFTLTLAATLVLLPLAAEARAAKPREAKAQTQAVRTAAAPQPPAEANLSGLKTTEYGTHARRATWQADPAHTYDARGVNCTLYPVRCRR